jgi:molybdopterin/thiamine biosynthesis adenylyltransferase
MNRYARQIVLPEVGEAGQARLAAAHALVVGAGGLGAPVLQYLAGAGVGRITVVDPDTVERRNLHRQTLYGERFLGRPKACAAAVALADLNPEVTVDPVVDRLDPASAPALVGPAAVVLDCADSFAVSYTLSDACLALGRPLISASALGLDGYVGGFCGGAPSLRAVFPDLPERAASCATAGILGPVVGVLGSLQAQMALAVLLGLAPSPLGQLVSFAGAGLRFGGFRFDGAPEPADALAFLAAAEIAAGDFVVDLRGPEEGPPVPGARRLGLADFGEAGPRPAPGQRAVLCCRSGLRSWQAARRLRRVWDGEIRLVALGDQPRLERELA